MDPDLVDRFDRIEKQLGRLDGIEEQLGRLDGIEEELRQVQQNLTPSATELPGLTSTNPL